MPDSHFLETYPLYKKFEIELPEILGHIKKVPVHLYCPHCKSEQTWNMDNEYSDGSSQLHHIGIRILLMKYLCNACNNLGRTYIVKFDSEENSVLKVGQYPAWNIQIDKNLSKSLGGHSDIYKNGLVCESQGYGIGALAYYRRIVETIIDELLDSIYDIIDEHDRKKYKEALDQTKTTRVTQDKIDLVKDLLPATLIADGMNPLGVLHSILSEGLHERNDDECLDDATLLRTSLIFLVEQVLKRKNESKKYTESMKNILEKRSKRIKKNKEDSDNEKEPTKT